MYFFPSFPSMWVNILDFLMNMNSCCILICEGVGVVFSTFSRLEAFEFYKVVLVYCCVS